MGRHGNDPSLHNRLRPLRTAQGLSQQGLALRAGLTRQAVNAIESGRYIPNTSVALRLARALDCRVEDLFHIDIPSQERQVHPAAAFSGLNSRAVLARVGDRLVAHPLTGGRALQEGFANADAVLSASGEQVTARLLIPEEQLERSALVMGCDPSLRLLVDHVSQHGRGGRLVWLAASSRQALDTLARGEAHLAGSHLRDTDGGYNVTHARQALGAGGLVVTLAAWEQGFLVAPGNPKKISASADLARPDVLLVNRERGAGCRQLLDELLDGVGIPSQNVRGYDTEAPGHLAVARAVASGSADVGLALQAAADVYDLDFIPLTQVRFDLVVPRAVLDHPAVSALMDALQTRALREELAALPGYEVSEMGNVAADIPSAA